MQRRLLLNVVVREGAPVFELLSREYETLLIGRDTFFVLDLCLDIVDRVRGLDVKRDRLAGERLHEDLHASPKAKHKVQGRLLLNVVVRKCTPVLELLSGEDEALLIWW